MIYRTSNTIVGQGYINGLIASTPGSSSALTVSAGVASDSTNVQIMTLNSSMTKSLAGTWVAGSGNNGLDTGTVAANTTYHVFLINNPTSGAVDVLFSLSPTNPTLPSGYVYKRRIFSMYTDSSSKWTSFGQLAGEVFITQAIGYTSDSLAASQTDLTITLGAIPVGIRVVANLVVNCASSGDQQTGLIFLTPTGLNVSSGWPASPLGNGTAWTGSNAWVVSNNLEFSGAMAYSSHVGGDAAGSWRTSSGLARLWTNTSAQINITTRNNFSSGNANRVRIQVNGWVDPRGQNGLL